MIETACVPPIRPEQRDCDSPVRAGGLEVEVVDAAVGDVEVRVADEEEEQGNGETFELEGEDECAPRRVAPDPGEPTAEEREDHRIDHLPYRCWCEHCVAGRGTGEQHRRGPECRIPVVSFDYLLITKTGVYVKGEQPKEEDVLVKILVVKDSMSKWSGAHVVSCKGICEDRYAAEKLKADVAWLGYTQVILRSDNEPAIVALLKEALRSLRVDGLERVAEAHPQPTTRRAAAASRML